MQLQTIILITFVIIIISTTAPSDSYYVKIWRVKNIFVTHIPRMYQQEREQKTECKNDVKFISKKAS